MSATTEMRGEHREEGHGSGGWRGAPGRHGGRSARGAEEHRRPPGAGQAGPVEWPGRGAGTSLALDTPPGGTAWTAGRDAEERRSPRRRTLAAVRVLEGPALGGQAAATDLSGDGAFIRTEAAVLAGTRLGLELVLPTDPKPIRLGARVVRTSATGIGVRFEDLSARDRSRLRSYAGFYEMDEAIVRVQRALGDLVPGNLLPLAEPEEIQAVVRTAAERRLEVHVIEPGRGFKPARAWIAELLAVPVAGRELPAMRLGGLRRPLGPATGAVYLVFADPPLHYAFEALVPEPGLRPVLLVPERIYLTERRTSRRAQAEGAWCELEAPWRPGGRLRLSVLDLSERGASVRLHGEVALLPGMRLPPFWLHTAEGQRRVAGATVRYVTGSSSGALRAGLHFELEETAAQAGAAAGGDPQGAAGQRQSAPAVVRRPARTGLGPGLWRALRGLGTRLWGRWAARAGSPSAPEVEVVRYRNRLGRTVAAIVDANFETGGDGSPADVAIVIAPAFLKRKEVFGLLARTLIDDLGAEGRRVVVLRFDACHVVGESTADAEQVARGQPYFNWTFSDMAADIEASLHYLERRFRPRARVLVSCSLSSISARYALRSAELPPVDLWVAPYGCPDAQDMLRNYLAGLDLFEVYRRGERAAPLLIHGRPMNPDRLYGQTMQDGLAFLEEARRDVARLAMPIVWILGQYDYWVTASRVREMLAAPGGGVREVFELPTGHVLKSGPEAIEVFKLVSESVAKHIFGQDRPARDPDLARFQRQSEAEWARVQRLELADAAGFWHDHLFGEHEGDLGYDVLLDHPDYREFLARHVELLDPQPGEALADFGCGTGNLALALAEAYEQGRAPASITFVDLVPEAVARTEQKLRAHYARRGGAVPELRGVVADLEVSRLAPVADFLAGRLHGVEALAERVEGFDVRTARKLAAHYGKELHAILRGRPSTAARLQQLCPSLEPEEVAVVLELGRAARFVAGEPLPDDLKPGAAWPPASTDELRLERLRFKGATRRLELPFAAHSFDRLGCSLVISYLYDPLAALREMHRVLRPGGTLVLSSPRRNFDPSKLYRDEAELLRRQAQGEAAAGGGGEAERKLVALRRFASMVGKLIELEDDGRFVFYDGPGLAELVREAGFSEVHAFEAFGSPPAAVIIHARR